MNKLTSALCIIIFGLTSANSIAKEVHKNELNNDELHSQITATLDQEMTQIMSSLLATSHAEILIANKEDKVLFVKREEKTSSSNENTADE